MEKLIIPEQNIINAVCVYIGRQNNVAPEEVEVELMYDDDSGFSAEANINGQTHILTTLNLIEALRQTIKEFLNLDPNATGIELILDDEEGIIAAVR
ncbi:YxcD family protein [Psychrobacillus sp. FSL H8-0484]|uniref:YxcD family protein n=1 Tax=Psychrobacillus sp. FSL H8-0484 TaxID=2921390 RepID=UPI0030F5A4D8